MITYLSERDSSMMKTSKTTLINIKKKMPTNAILQQFILIRGV